MLRGLERPGVPQPTCRFTPNLHSQPGGHRLAPPFTPRVAFTPKHGPPVSEQPSPGAGWAPRAKSTPYAPSTRSAHSQQEADGPCPDRPTEFAASGQTAQQTHVPVRAPPLLSCGHRWPAPAQSSVCPRRPQGPGTGSSPGGTLRAGPGARPGHASHARPQEVTAPASAALGASHLCTNSHSAEGRGTGSPGPSPAAPKGRPGPGHTWCFIGTAWVAL